MLISGGKNARKKPKVEIRDALGNKISLKKFKAAHKEEVLKSANPKKGVVMRGLSARKYTLADVIKKYTFSDFLNEQEALRINENVGVIDEHLSDLCDFIGRLLTEEETNDILDIVDEYTPKDKDGDYLGPLLPFDYAWEIYQIKKEQA